MIWCPLCVHQLGGSAMGPPCRVLASPSYRSWGHARSTRVSATEPCFDNNSIRINDGLAPQAEFLFTRAAGRGPHRVGVSR